MTVREAVYGAPPLALAHLGENALQTSPFVIGSTPLEDLADGDLDRFTLLAPPGALERRHVLAQAVRALRPGGELIALAPRNAGGARLARELTELGCEVRENARRRHRICLCERPAQPTGVREAIAKGGPQFVAATGLWSQPGLFAWSRIDPGTALLIAQPWTVGGSGADFGCGAGALARALLTRPEIARLALIDIDRRAIDAARRNLADTRASFVRHDLRRPPVGLAGLDFVIMNPPFHDGGEEDRQLGRDFVASARSVLRCGGVLRMVANVALPYERALEADFASWRPLARANGYKVLEATA